MENKFLLPVIPLETDIQWCSVYQSWLIVIEGQPLSESKCTRAVLSSHNNNKWSPIQKAFMVYIKPYEIQMRCMKHF